MALTDAVALMEVGIGASRRTAQIVQYLEGHDLTSSAIGTTVALHVRCKGAPLQPKLEAGVAGMVTNGAVTQAAQQPHKPMVQASALSLQSSWWWLQMCNSGLYHQRLPQQPM